LTANGGIDPRVTVAMYVAPQTGDSVEQLSSVGCGEGAAFGVPDHQRLVFRHLREAVPVSGTLVGGDHGALKSRFCGSQQVSQPIKLVL
jgi:small ligand-binding sensory domain FIST